MLSSVRGASIDRAGVRGSLTKANRATHNAGVDVHADVDVDVDVDVVKTWDVVVGVVG